MSDLDQRRPNAPAADVPGALERGREAYGRRAWGDAYRLLSRADQAAPLTGGDLELLATAAYLTGRDGVLSAVDARTGEGIWNVALDGEMNYSPAITGGRIYVGNWASEVIALGALADAATPAP